MPLPAPVTTATWFVGFMVEFSPVGLKLPAADPDTARVPCLRDVRSCAKVQDGASQRAARCPHQGV